MRRAIPPAQLCALQQKPDRTRNICILAHVDHGKTTLADSLVASNGVISSRLAGKLRYMDSREDEQLRGITMKSSAIALLFQKEAEEYLVNLVDSPGHVDFSSEVSTAVRACDGAIVLVDAVEGVCPQTHVVLRQAWREGVKPVLVVNKIDRLIMELQMTPTEAHLHLQQVLEQVNAVTGALFATEVMETAEREAEEAEGKASSGQDSNDQVYEDWDLGFDKKDEESLYFAPDQGNVVFASAVDGWGFRISDFANLYAAKLGIKAQILRRTLWGDYYLNMKAKRIMKGAQAKGKKPLFVQFVLDNMWAVYDAVTKGNKEKVMKITAAMNLTIAARDMRSTDPKVQLQAICGQWLPLAKSVLGMVIEHLPCPLQMTPERAERLLCGHQRALLSYPERTQALKADLLACSSRADAPVVAFVSKMFPVAKSDLAQSKTSAATTIPVHARAVTAEEIAARRQQAKLMSQQRSAVAEATATNGGCVTDVSTPPVSAASVTHSEPSPTDSTSTSSARECHDTPATDGEEEESTVLLAFTRVFSGTLRPNRSLLVLRARHDPSDFADGSQETDDPARYPRQEDDAAIVSCQPTQLYMLMGRELIAIDSAPAGSIVGVAGIDSQILRHGTISSTTALPPLAAMEFPTSAVVRVALEPGSAGDMGLMLRGLRRLRAADCAVEYAMESSGECVLSTAGEVHLGRCLDDLRTIYAPGLVITHSDPIVPFRETIILPPEVDMVNETIERDTAPRQPTATASGDYADQDADGDVNKDPNLVVQYTADRSITLHVRAIPLPAEVGDFLEKNVHHLKALALLIATQESGGTANTSLTESTISDLREFKDQFTALLKPHDKLKDIVDSIAAFGPREIGPNILVNGVPDYHRPSVWRNLGGSEGRSLSLRQMDHCVLHGFQLATLAGPLCEEPMHGVCFMLEEWASTASDTQPDTHPQAASVTAEPSSSKPIPIAREVIDPASSPLPGSGGLIPSSYDSLGHSYPNEGSLSPSLGSGPLASHAPVSAYGPISGQLMSASKEACRRCFLAQPPRIMAAMYSCEIHATSEVLGRVYAVLGRRGGRVVHEDLRPGSTNVFSVRAVVPVAESFGFAPEIRKKTSGLASPQLFFSHWEVVPSDPFWVPTTEEELLHFGEKADSANLARLYVNGVRRRKGLAVDEKIVEHAEKQRTMMRT